MHARLILNPASRGSPGRQTLADIEETLRRGGIPVETLVASGPGEARRLAADAARGGARMVICAGGDGTIHEVVNGIAGTDAVLGILPAGTGNVLAWELGIPLDLVEASRVLLDGRVRTVDLGHIAGGNYFSCMGGVGLDAQVVRDLPPAAKELLGKAAYLLSGIRSVLRCDLPALSIRTDECPEPIVGYAMVVCNARHYGGRYVVCHEAALDDGWLHACVLQRPDRRTIIHMGLRILARRRCRTEGVSFMRARTILVTSASPVLVQVDGDVCGTTPVEFSIAPGALRVMTPAPAR
ncbi:MAG: diacylglycerol kinase family lipid kinase [bacterium]|nr:diacylglycerol kinase family lipid kinase [bacterium]